MKFVWAGEREKQNNRLSFELKLEKDVDTLVLYGADFYRVYLDGKFVSYGPERTAAGYARKRVLDIKGAKYLCIDLSSYGIPTYSNDYQLPYLGAEILSGKDVVYTALDFEARRYSCVIDSQLRYSVQRGFMEQYDFTKTDFSVLPIYEVDAPVLIDGIGDKADYSEVGFEFLGEREFAGVKTVSLLWWQNRQDCKPFEGQFNIQKDFIEKAKGYREYNYALETERTGFIKLNVKASEEIEVFTIFEEVIPDGEEKVENKLDDWFFRRSACNDLVVVKFPVGEYEFITSEPYAFKYLKLVVSGDAEITPSVITFENAHADRVKVSGNEKFAKVFEAAKNSFRQNAVDIFMDCPGRERAGWLCDTFFTAKAERTLTAKNTIERAYLENHIIGSHEEIDERMFMMIFPGQSKGGTYIPNWAMWFVIELEDYLARTGDRTLVDKARDKVYGLIDFFKKYKNEDGLLENLESWVFIEWSVCNDAEYTKGVNYPSNMLYAYMLEKASILYNDKKLNDEAETIKKTILSQSFDGNFFADNAVRENGKLVRCDTHVSETCQYYALFTGIDTSMEYKKKIAQEFGPLRAQDKYPEIGRSNMFIGNYLRFFWLCEIGEYDRVITECLEYFAEMAEKTGTLWEHDSPTASCNHGFTSVASELLLRCAVGFMGVKDGKPVFDKDFKPKKDYGVKVEFNY